MLCLLSILRGQVVTHTSTLDPVHPSCLCSTPVSPPGMRACLLHFREFEPRVRHRPGFTVAVAVLEPPRSGGLGDVLCWVSAVPRPDAAVGSKWAFCMQRRRGGRYRGCAGRVCAGRCRLTPKLAGLQLQYILRPGRKRGAFGEGSTAMTGPSAARQRVLCRRAVGCISGSRMAKSAQIDHSRSIPPATRRICAHLPPTQLCPVCRIVLQRVHGHCG